MSDELVRLSKLMAERGICSRREADGYIGGSVFSRGNPFDPTWNQSPPTVNITSRQRPLTTAHASNLFLNKPSARFSPAGARLHGGRSSASLGKLFGAWRLFRTADKPERLKGLAVAAP